MTLFSLVHLNIEFEYNMNYNSGKVNWLELWKISIIGHKDKYFVPYKQSVPDSNSPS